jgi:hypothetical protein
MACYRNRYAWGEIEFAPLHNLSGHRGWAAKPIRSAITRSASKGRIDLPRFTFRLNVLSNVQLPNVTGHGRPCLIKRNVGKKYRVSKEQAPSLQE